MPVPVSRLSPSPTAPPSASVRSSPMPRARRRHPHRREEGRLRRHGIHRRPRREAQPVDDMVDIGGGKVFVNPQATLFLLGTEMDFEVTKLRTGFVFRNPNQTSACGCGESVEIRPASEERAGRGARLSGRSRLAARSLRAVRPGFHPPHVRRRRRLPRRRLLRAGERRRALSEMRRGELRAFRAAGCHPFVYERRASPSTCPTGACPTRRSTIPMC